jgi:hypothetical protein
MAFDLQAHHLKVAVPPHSPQLVWYDHNRAQFPKRDAKVFRDHWWVVSRPYSHLTGSRLSLLFVRTEVGDIPQCSDITENIELMKRILFPWAEVLKLPQVYLVKHKTQGWYVPDGQIS